MIDLLKEYQKYLILEIDNKQYFTENQKEYEKRLTIINIDDFDIDYEIREKGTGKDISPRQAIYQLKSRDNNELYIFTISLESDFYKQYYRENIINKILN